MGSNRLSMIYPLKLLGISGIPVQVFMCRLKSYSWSEGSMHLEKLYTPGDSK